MAAGVRARLGVDVGVAVTGIAGPDGGTPEKPVGLVYLHAETPDGGRRHGVQLPVRPGDDPLARHRRGAPPRAASFVTESRRRRVTSSGTVEADERVRLFCALTLPDDVLDRIVAWQARLPEGRARIVPRENLHLTLAFLGHRPERELAAIGKELGEASAAAGEITPARAALPRDPERRNARLLGREGRRRCARPRPARGVSSGWASTSRSNGPGCRTSPWCGSASGRASSRRRPALRTYVRPALLFTYPYCGPQAPSTLSSRNMH